MAHSRSALLLALAVLLATAAPRAARGAPALDFVRHDLRAGRFAQVNEGIDVGDIDGDGRPDVVVGGDAYLLWYHSPDWTPHAIATGFRFGAGARVLVRDMDGDGRLDVVTGKYRTGDEASRQTVWFRNTPAGWVEHPLSATAYCHDLAFGDLDGDGLADAACTDEAAGEIVWLRAPAYPTAWWPTRLVEARSAMGLALADVDGDGRLDAVAGRAWYGFDGTAWTRHPYTTLEDAADPRFSDYAKVDVLDLDGDGRPDVFATLFAESREGEVWAFFAPPDPRAGPWTGVRIDPGPLFGVHSQAPADFDGTGRPQVMVGETRVGGWDFGPNPHPHLWVYRLLGPARDPASWERALVARAGTHEARAADLDGDGRPDVAGEEENTDLLRPPRPGRVTWWRNVTGVRPARARRPRG
ncbi:MAG TPA: VCBS repeat-containing protein [Candidatus Binatia bacterium]|nr:VCBS repeat-containing protein [Candidatus Binatia bacterium]